MIFAVGVPAVLAADRGVRIEGFAYAPRTLTIAVGDRVTWTNGDPVEHTATARNGAFDTGLLGEGESASIRFTVAGTYRYLCTPHPNMTGTIVVRASGGLTPPYSTTLPGDVTPAANGDPRVGLLAVVAGLAVLALDRALRRRRRPLEVPAGTD